LARQTGRTVAEAQATISSREFAEWQVFEKLHGPGEPERSDLRMALLDWHMHRLIIGGKKMGKVGIDDLMLKFRRRPKMEDEDYGTKRKAWLQLVGK